MSTLRPDRLTCEEAGYHLPGCYSPLHDRTWCICGVESWPGQTGTWHSVERVRILPVEIPRGVGMGAGGYDQPTERLGWDTYWLEAT